MSVPKGTKRLHGYTLMPSQDGRVIVSRRNHVAVCPSMEKAIEFVNNVVAFTADFKAAQEK